MLSRKIQFALTLVAAILIPGLADYALASAGYKTLAGLVWTGGYGFGVIAIWYLWIRPLELTGPAGIQFTEDEESQHETDSATEETTPS
jgi:hypothetical protein